MEGVGLSRCLRQFAWLSLLGANSCALFHERDGSHSSMRELDASVQLPDSGSLVDSSLPCTRDEIADGDAAGELPGQLNIEFKTAITPGITGTFDSTSTDSPNCGVVWIQDEHGALVKTLDYWASRICSTTLVAYNSQFLGSCTIDVMTRPSMHSYAVNDYVWNGESLHGTVVPDGNYKLMIDVQIDDDHPIDTYELPFTKGRTPYVLKEQPLPPQTGLTLTYTPR